MTLSVRRSGEALRAAAGDLVRFWRAARYSGGGPVFPGLLDGVIEEFLSRVAEALLLDGRPEDAWPSVRGVIRVPEPAQAAAVLADEWGLARQVLFSACDALEVPAEVASGVQRAVDAAMAGIGPVIAGAAPRGVVIVRQLAGFKPRGDSRSGGRR